MSSNIKLSLPEFDGDNWDEFKLAFTSAIGMNGWEDHLADDHAVNVVVLTGAGDRAFIGGANIHEMAGLDPERARAFIPRLHRMCLCLRDLPVPVIARINGYALGAGLEKLSVQMTVDQQAAIALFESLGFKAEALLRAHRNCEPLRRAEADEAA